MEVPCRHPDFLPHLLESRKYSDLEIACKDERFFVHKAVMCIQSPVLSAACNGQFKESTTNKIVVEEFDIEAVRCMIEFMYTGDYKDGISEKHIAETVSESQRIPPESDNKALGSKENENETKAQDSDKPSSDYLPRHLGKGKMAKTVLCHVKANSIADYYNIPSLKRLSAGKIETILYTAWDSTGFAGVLNYAFESAPDKHVHEILAMATANNIEDLFNHSDFIELDSLNEFSTYIIAYKVDEIRALKNQVELLKHKLCAENDKVNAERMMCEKEKGRADRIICNTDRVLDKLYKTSTCCGADCNAEFHCHIEKRSPIYEPKYILTCSKCRHKFE